MLGAYASGATSSAGWHGVPNLAGSSRIMTDTCRRCRRSRRSTSRTSRPGASASAGSPASGSPAHARISPANIGPNLFHQENARFVTNVEAALEQRVARRGRRRRSRSTADPSAQGAIRPARPLFGSAARKHPAGRIRPFRRTIHQILTRMPRQHPAERIIELAVRLRGGTVLSPFGPKATKTGSALSMLRTDR